MIITVDGVTAKQYAGGNTFYNSVSTRAFLTKKSEYIHDQTGNDHDQADDLRQSTWFFQKENTGKNANG